MGDRTNITIYCKTEDVQAMRDALDVAEFNEEEEFAEGVMELYDAEITPDTSGMPGDKVWLYRHGYGHEYGPHEGVCDGEEESHWETGHQGGYVIDAPQLDVQVEKLKAHIERVRKVEAMLGIAK